MDWKRGSAALLAGALLVAGSAAVTTRVDDQDAAPLKGVRVLALDPATQYQGKCSVVTPPEPDPCDAAALTIANAFLSELVNAQLHKNWVKANPGEVARLNTWMAAPKCSTPANPQTPSQMLTRYGRALYWAFSAYACALGTEAIQWPVPDPPLDPRRADKTPPTAPTGLTVTLNP